MEAILSFVKQHLANNGDGKKQQLEAKLSSALVQKLDLCAHHCVNVNKFAATRKI